MVIFFFNDTATTEIYTLSLHDALPISGGGGRGGDHALAHELGLPVGVDRPAVDVLLHQVDVRRAVDGRAGDRKSTRLNSSHANISYAVFCLKKKNTSELQSRTYLLCLL